MDVIIDFLFYLYFQYLHLMKIFGVIYLLLILVFKYRQEKQEQKKILNDLNQKYDSLKNDSSLKEKMLKNMSIDYDALKGRLDSINKECYAKTNIVLDCSRFSGMEGILNKKNALFYIISSSETLKAN